MRTSAVLLLLLGLVAPGWAARNTPADQPVSVKLELSQPTALAFPEPVASVSTGMPPERFSLDYDGSYLFLLPLDPTCSGRLFVVGHSGKLYTIVFKVGGPADDVVHLVVQAPQPQKVAPFGVPSFLRALRSGTPIPGQQAIDVPAPVVADARLLLVSSQAIALGDTIGLAVTLRNVKETSVAVDIRLGATNTAPESTVTLAQWVWPPRLTIKALAIDDDVIPPQGQTTLYVILERRP